MEKDENAVGDESVKVYPVRAALSRLDTSDSNCVVSFSKAFERFNPDVGRKRQGACEAVGGVPQVAGGQTYLLRDQAEARCQLKDRRAVREGNNRRDREVTRGRKYRGWPLSCLVGDALPRVPPVIVDEGSDKPGQSRLQSVPWR